MRSRPPFFLRLESLRRDSSSFVAAVTLIALLTFSLTLSLTLEVAFARANDDTQPIAEAPNSSAQTNSPNSPAATTSFARTTRPYSVTETREPCAEYAPLRRPFFGDTHVHTTHSQDASTQDTRTTPRQAYAFAKGETLGIQPFDANGASTRQVALHRPLDFAIVTDHAEQIGEVHICKTAGAEGKIPAPEVFRGVLSLRGGPYRKQTVIPLRDHGEFGGNPA